MSGPAFSGNPKWSSDFQVWLMLICCVQDPEVSAAFADISQNPANIAKYASNPKIQKLLKKMQGTFGGGAGTFGGADVEADDENDSPRGGDSSASGSTKTTPHVPTQPDID